MRPANADIDFYVIIPRRDRPVAEYAGRLEKPEGAGKALSRLLHQAPSFAAYLTETLSVQGRWYPVTVVGPRRLNVRV